MSSLPQYEVQPTPDLPIMSVEVVGLMVKTEDVLLLHFPPVKSVDKNIQELYKTWAEPFNKFDSPGGFFVRFNRKTKEFSPWDRDAQR